MTVYLEDDFETGNYTPYWGLGGVGGFLPPTVQSEHVMTGKYSIRFDHVGGPVQVFVNKIITPITSGYFRFYVYLHTWSAGSYIALLQGSAGVLLYVGIDATQALTLNYFDEALVYHTLTGSVTIPTMGWHSIEIGFDIISGNVHMWLDGIQDPALTVTTGDILHHLTNPVNFVNIGLWAGGYNWMYFDTCKLASDYIGPLLPYTPLIYPLPTFQQLTTSAEVSICGARVRTLRHLSNLVPWVSF